MQADFILQNNVSRKELLQKMEQIGKELEPLITRNFNMNILRSFNPIPYTPLVHVCKLFSINHYNDNPLTESKQTFYTSFTVVKFC